MNKHSNESSDMRRKVKNISTGFNQLLWVHIRLYLYI